jgi:hypothetical protein
MLSCERELAVFEMGAVNRLHGGVGLVTESTDTLLLGKVWLRWCSNLHRFLTLLWCVFPVDRFYLVSAPPDGEGTHL